MKIKLGQDQERGYDIVDGKEVWWVADGAYTLIIDGQRVRPNDLSWTDTDEVGKVKVSFTCDVDETILKQTIRELLANESNESDGKTKTN